MKRTVSLVLVVLAIVTVLAGCSSSIPETPAAQQPSSTNQTKSAAICVPSGSDEFFTFISSMVKDTLTADGYTVQIADANNDTQTMVRQIQNFIVAKVDFLYVFPAGDAAAFHDVMKEATDAGIKTLVSHNNTGDGSALAFIQCDEFIMGTMMAPLITQWLDKEYPDAGPGEIKALALEVSFIPDMVKRSTGMKIVGEKYLRKVDMVNATYIKTNGDPVSFIDKSGNEMAVDEPTGGLILDENGHAMLNPFYDERVNVISISNRIVPTNIDAQNALDIFVTADGGANRDVKIVMCYSGDAASGASEKLISLAEQGVIEDDLSKLAVFGADITETNSERIKESAENKSLVRGVMTNGNIIETIVVTVGKMARGESVPAQSWEDLGYMTLNDAKTDTAQVLYNGQLPETDKFFD